MSLTTALRLCTTGSALMGLSPSNCPTGDGRVTNRHKCAQILKKNTDSHKHTPTDMNRQPKHSVHKCSFYAAGDLCFLENTHKGRNRLTLMSCTHTLSKGWGLIDTVYYIKYCTICVKPVHTIDDFHPDLPVANKFCQSPTKASDRCWIGIRQFLCELFKTQIKKETEIRSGSGPAQSGSDRKCSRATLLLQ